MYSHRGLFYPENFPWPYEHAIAVLHKAAVVNGVCGKVVLRVALLRKALRRSKKGRKTDLNLAVGEIYSASHRDMAYSNDPELGIDYFPKRMFGPVKYCAECLAETGFVPAVFSLRFVVSCPWHQQPLKPLCPRCHDIRNFTPAPFGSPVGYRCEDCGYWVPTRGAIFATCRTYETRTVESACYDFWRNTERLFRLAVLDVIHFDKATDEGGPVLTDGCVIPEFSYDGATKTWWKHFDLRCPSAAPSSPDECYRSFMDFHQLRLLAAHRDCPCGAMLARPDFGDASRSMCLYSAALSILRQKFEYLDGGEGEPRLSDLASRQLAELQMEPRAARRFFQCVFYQLIARLWFWSRAASRFVVHIDARYVLAVLDASGNCHIWLSRLLGEYLREYLWYEFDLPANRAALRQLLGPAQVGQALQLRNFGTRAELSGSAKPRLFYGWLRATPMFYC